MKRLTPLIPLLLCTLITPSAHALDIPGFDVENVQVVIDGEIRAVLKASASGDEGPEDGIHWRVDFDANAVLSELPVLTCDGGSCDAFLELLPHGFEVALSMPVDVKLHGRAKVNSWWSPELKATADLHQVVGVTVRVPISPALERGEVTVDFTRLDGNVDVQGLERAGAKLGSLVGGFGLGVGFGVGAGLGAIAGNAAEKPIKRALEEQFAKLLEAASRSATNKLNDYLGSVHLAMRQESLQEVQNYSQFSLQTGTALHETGDTFEFALATNGDLFAISKSGTGSGTTEVHVLSAESGYQEFSLHTATALGETGANYEFALTPDRDLVAIAKSGTGTGTTEVHILSAASNYSEFVLQTGTALHETGDSFELELAANGDLFAISKSGTGTGSTEVHVLSAASQYQEFSLHTGTALHETGGSFKFLLAANGDLFALSKSGTGTGSTEVHVLSAGSQYQEFSLHTGTALHETGGSFDFVLSPDRDLYALSKSGTGTSSTEVHVLAH